MAPTAEQSIAQSQAEGAAQVRELLAYVTGVGSRTASAYDVEVRIFRGVLALGGTLLRLFFESRAAERPSGPVVGADDTVLAYHDRRPVTYLSVFGKLVFWRHAFAAPGQAMVYPLDAGLSLPERCYSDLLREWSGFGSADASFREVAASLERILGWSLSVQALETNAREDAVDVPAFYERSVEATALPPASGQAASSILVAQADGKGVPMVQPPPAERPARRGKGHPSNRLREAVVTALYTIQPYPRTPEAVAAALLRDPDQPAPGQRPRPITKELRATLDGKAVAMTRLAARAERREGPQIRDRVALTDGAEALQDQMRAALPAYTLVLDIIHAVEYLWDAANALLGERHPERTAWVRGHLVLLLQGRTDAVLTALTATADERTLSDAQQKACAATIRYYRRNAPYMRYDQYLERGWPIGTGVIESACGHLVKDRMEQAGMRWTKDGAHAILDLRAVRVTDDWDAYWAFHRQRQHHRLYGTASSLPRPPEAQALASHAAA
jgi:hypothetical protein